MRYDDANPDSIKSFAKQLEGKTMRKAVSDIRKAEASGGQAMLVAESTPAYTVDKAYKGKGGFGNELEEYYFGKKNDNVSQPDFPKAKLELKASPLKKVGKETKVKERLILNHFKYTEIAQETFETSHFLMKDSQILLVFYWYEKGADPKDQKVDLVDIWKCMQEDGPQIRQDWETIVAKVKAGRAEDISEGDTLYLGACTKGAKKESNWQIQPYSDVKAQGRALCFKQGYINQIYKILRERKRKEHLHRFLTKDETFEQRIEILARPYLHMTATAIAKELNIKFDAKSKYALLARKILGYSSAKDEFYEFKAANIQIKEVRIERNGRIKESMSFKPIVFTEIVDQDWEDSDIYENLTSKFIFFVFKRNQEDTDYILTGVKFWNMPEQDLEFYKEKVFEPTKAAIAKGDFENLPKIKDHVIGHVRTHAKNKADTMETPIGTWETKRSFWLNSEYILKVVTE